ncbi:MAG TPA: NADP-dependent malic enzyme, partial [Chloroflexi bacterium]|nr:NADP-dependent malic enzyme [Chloroflexota bacterium]
MLTREELLARAEKPSEEAMKLHPFYKGKIEMVAKCVIRDFQDFGIWYTPGVAAPCRAIAEDKELAYEYTNKWNTIAVVTDGTRVLGLGDIGPEAAMPVMEGKALLFKYLGGVDAVPICLDTKDPEQFMAAVKLLQPSFGGINLEDISQPKCFRILDTLRQEMQIPVWHDDQQGTAAVTLAGLINALEIVGKSLSEARIAMIGAGAANLCIARLLISAGVTPGHIIISDSKGTLHRGRTDLKEKYAEKWEMCLQTNEDDLVGGNAEAIRGADVLIALSTPGPGTVKPEWVAEMAQDAIVFACANPVPEIWPWEAKEAGARIVATGRSDFPNQVNNSLG